ncbi:MULTISPECIES: hypothetical protein [Sinorhizobium]|uniref:hypothetical protein n=1 Tax=Sinorhizobium TaxID=28105 RepID=UPI000FDAF250|nr:MULTISPECIES: hypothetical protein [Sinorhizobium]RVJ37388.1 hypothetical protein CN180_25520 [Sinorhizobium medicae]WRQ71852.1 hypothetical protein SO078_30430 [Sinorhizobium meliloti]
MAERVEYSATLGGYREASTELEFGMSLSRIVGIVTTILGGVGIYALLSQSTEALSFTRAHAAFLAYKGLDTNPIETEIRTRIETLCAPVAAEKLHIAAANEAISQSVAVLAKAKSLTVDVVSQILTQAAQLDEEAPHEAQCVAALTILRSKYPDVWRAVDQFGTKDDRPLADIGRVIDAASK